MPNSASRNSGTAFPLSPAERSRLYHQRFPVPRKSRKIKISDEKIYKLVKRGYLGPNELDDAQAVREALSLFLCDALLGVPRHIASKGAKRLGGKDQESR
jgi:hypothetical protein